MGLTIAKVSYSPVISEGRDFTGAIFDADGRLVACGDHDLPGLLGTLEPTLEFVLSWFAPEEIHEGDVIICNSPHEAGTHLNDVRLVKPVFADGKLAAFVADLGHWTDVGGSVPGSINPLARRVHAGAPDHPREDSRQRRASPRRRREDTRARSPAARGERRDLCAHQAARH